MGQEFVNSAANPGDENQCGQAYFLSPFPKGLGKAEIWLAPGHTTMRRGMRSMALPVRQALRKDIHARDPFAFRGRFVWSHGGAEIAGKPMRHYRDRQRQVALQTPQRPRPKPQQNLASRWRCLRPPSTQHAENWPRFGRRSTGQPSRVKNRSPHPPWPHKAMFYAPVRIRPNPPSLSINDLARPRYQSWP
jgi:hypothetical protein